MLTHDEFKEKIDTILKNNEDIGLISEVLNEVHNNYSGVLSTLSELEEKNNTLKDYNASLVKANGELFMNRGIGKQEEITHEEEKPSIKSLDEVLEEMTKGK